MRIDLFDMDEFIDLNKLKEVTSPVLFERGGTPNPDGLISNEIFGVSTKQRKETFAYIDLHGHFFHPHIYKIMKRVFRNVDKIINGEEYYSITKEGALVKDPDDGETGIDFLYNNWNKIKWSGNGGMSSERTNLISKSKKNEVFISKMVVIPAFYRDIHSAPKGKGGGEVPEIDNLYVKLIRMSSLLKDKDMFDFSFHTTNYNIQNTIVDAYNYFKDKLDKKKGLLRKYLLGKNVDYAVRTVISAPVYNTERPEDNIVDFRHAAVPISQICVMCYPFVVAWLKNFFERELIENKLVKWNINIETGDELDNGLEIVNPEAFYSDTYIKKHIDKFISDPSSRYDKIEVPTNSTRERYLVFTGKLTNIKAEQVGIVRRHLTWTDLLFMACSDITKDKHIMVTRYPILDNFGIFITKIRVASTLQTVPMNINGTIYKWYPVINLNMTKEQVGNNFIDTTRFSNSYLKGLDGDYDGDQVTSKILWTQEANEECEKVINSKKFVLSSRGSNMRAIDLEAIQTFYVLTKDPNK